MVKESTSVPILAVSILLFITSVPLPLAAAGSCELPFPFYAEEFEHVFENMVNKNWDESGNWRNDWGAVDDATSFAPPVLYRCAQKHRDEELKRRADRTVEYEIRLIDKIIGGDRNMRIITKAGGGQEALITGRQYYSRDLKNRTKIEIYSRGMAIGASFVLICRPEMVEKSAVGEVWTISSIANYNFRLAEITGNKMEREIYKRLGEYLIKNILEKYWKEDTYGGYYKGDFYGKKLPEGPVAFEQGMPLTALARAYKATSDNFYLNRAEKIKETLDKNLWDEDRKGYFASVESDVKLLSGNNQICRGYLLWYEVLEKESFVKRAEEIFDFVVEDIYCVEHVFFGHDTRNPDWYCSGCNFRTLDNLWIISKIYGQ